MGERLDEYNAIKKKDRRDVEIETSAFFGNCSEPSCWQFHHGAIEITSEVLKVNIPQSIRTNIVRSARIKCTEPKHNVQPTSRVKMILQRGEQSQRMQSNKGEQK